MARISTSSAGGTVSIEDSTGQAITSTDGALNVNVVSTGPSSIYTIFQVFNEVMAIAPGIETTIASFTVLSSNLTYLQFINSSSGNIGEIRIYRNNVLVDKNYIYYTAFNIGFDYRTDVINVPGLPLFQNDLIEIKGLNSGQDDCNMNAKLQFVEVVS